MNVPVSNFAPPYADALSLKETMRRLIGLVGAPAAIDCEVEEIIERHSHAILLGAVRDVRRDAGLVYGHGRFGSLNLL